jgi:hypothetical protein
MNTDANIKKIKKIVDQTLTRDFDRVAIRNIEVQKGLDRDGEEVLRIAVVFDGERKDVDARKLSGAVRQVRPKLQAIGERAFPLFSFISSGDARRVGLEPA